MERWQRANTEIFGGSSDAKAGTTDRSGEIGKHDERGEAAIDGAALVDETVAAQGISEDDGKGVGGGMAESGIPDRNTMNRTQRKRFKEALRRIQGRK